MRRICIGCREVYTNAGIVDIHLKETAMENNNKRRPKVGVGITVIQQGLVLLGKRKGLPLFAPVQSLINKVGLEKLKEIVGESIFTGGS